MGEFGPVYLHTQPFLFWKPLQYKLIINNNVMIAVIEVPMVENNLSSMDDQKVVVMTQFLLRYCLC